MRHKPFLLGLAAAALALSGLAPFAIGDIMRAQAGPVQVAQAPVPPAQDRRVPRAGEERLSYAPVVRKVAPAVVNVYAAKVVRNRNPLFDDPIFRQFFGDGGMGGGAQVQRSLGSGVIVDPSGLIVTNVHVIEGADEVKVALNDKREYEATLVLKDPRSDLAVLKLKTNERFPFVDLANSDALQVGDVVIAIGDPFGVGQTVTHGIVSALARSDIGTNNYQFYIQTDAAINPGNSGGALVDLDGKLVGINNAIFSRSGGWQGIGFAIPANMVKVVLASAKSGGTDVKRPWLGARLQAVTPEIAESLGVKRPAGALVSRVLPDSPAAKGGLRDGDLIVAVDGQPVDDPNAFDYRFATQPLGGTGKLSYWRAGKEYVASVPLATAPEAPADELTIKTRTPFGGAKVANLSPALADRLQIATVDAGVVVVDVGDNSYASSFGFQHGDVVLEVNGQKINSTRDLERITRNPATLWRVTILRGGQRISAVFGG